MEKPKEGASWKEIPKHDKAYVQKCKDAMQNLWENGLDTKIKFKNPRRSHFGY